MRLISISLKKFRSHKETDLDFSQKINFIVGGNGDGKTSLLEAIYYLSTKRSFITRTDSEVVSFNEKEFEIDGVFEEKTKNKVRVYYSLKENKKVYLKNKNKIIKAIDIIGHFPVVALTPSDLSITKGYPSDRRKFVDSIISQSNKTYLKNLVDYSRTLKQRAILLNIIKERREESLLEELNAWTEKLVQSGLYLLERRKSFVIEFSTFICNSYKKIMGTNETPSFLYSFLAKENNNSENDERSFRILLNKRKEEEIRRGSNLVGPHRDEFVFKINKLNLKTYGSQGQHKTFQIALRFAEFFYLKQTTGKTPIFLLDDVFSKLDRKRANKISEYLRDIGQAFITITDLTDFSFIEKQKDDLMIKVNKGKAVYA